MPGNHQPTTAASHPSPCTTGFHPPGFPTCFHLTPLTAGPARPRRVTSQWGPCESGSCPVFEWPPWVSVSRRPGCGLRLGSGDGQPLLNHVLSVCEPPSPLIHVHWGPAVGPRSQRRVRSEPVTPPPQVPLSTHPQEPFLSVSQPGSRGFNHSLSWGPHWLRFCPRVPADCFLPTGGPASLRLPHTRRSLSSAPCPVPRLPLSAKHHLPCLSVCDLMTALPFPLSPLVAKHCFHLCVSPARRAAPGMTGLQKEWATDDQFPARRLVRGPAGRVCWEEPSVLRVSRPGLWPRVPLAHIEAGVGGARGSFRPRRPGPCASSGPGEAGIAERGVCSQMFIKDSGLADLQF